MTALCKGLAKLAVIAASFPTLCSAEPGWAWLNPLPQGNLLWAVASDAQTRIAVGLLGTIVRTSDGGESWTLPPSGTRNSLHGVAFAEANTAVAVGEQGTIVRSIDGGATWTVLAEPRLWAAVAQRSSTLAFRYRARRKATRSDFSPAVRCMLNRLS